MRGQPSTRRPQKQTVKKQKKVLSLEEMAPPSPLPAAAAGNETAAASSSSSSLRRPPSAGRLASFASDPSLSLSSLPNKKQQPAPAPPHHAAWGAPTGAGGAFSAGVTPTAAAAGAAAAAGGGLAAGRTWLKVDAEGRASVARVDKASLAAELGVQARDLRLLDPHFNHSYPSAILCRDRVIFFFIFHFHFFFIFFFFVEELSSSFSSYVSLFFSLSLKHPNRPSSSTSSTSS